MAAAGESGRQTPPAQPGPAARLRGRGRASALPGRGGRDRDEPARAVRGRLRAGGGPRRPAAGAHDAQGAAVARRGSGWPPGPGRSSTRSAALLEEADAVRAPFTGVLRLGVIPTVAPVSAAAVLGLVHETLPGPGPPGARGADRLPPGGPGPRTPRPAAARGARWASPRSPNSRSSTRTSCWSPPRTTGSAAASDIPRQALQELDLLLLDEGHCLRDQALDICREAGRGRDTPVTTSAAGPVHPGAAGRRRARRDPAAAHRTTRRDRPQRPAHHRLLRRPGAFSADRARHADGRRPPEEFEEFAGALRGALRGLPVRMAEG